MNPQKNAQNTPYNRVLYFHRVIEEGCFPKAAASTFGNIITLIGIAAKSLQLADGKHVYFQ